MLKNDFLGHPDNNVRMCDLGRSVFTQKPSASTVMLLAVSFFHIATTLPVAVCYSLYYSFPPGHLTLRPQLSMGWVDPWVGLGRDFSVIGALGRVVPWVGLG